MLSKSPIHTVAIVAIITLGHSTVANADMFIVGSGKNQNIVITGLTTGNSYTMNYNDKHNQSKTLTKTAQNCSGSGQIIIDKARKYKALSLGGQSVDYNDVRSMPACTSPAPEFQTESEANP